jgi:hypothetical protein
MLREVIEALEGRGLRYYITGSEAMARYAAPRTTLDVDVVVEVTESGFAALAEDLQASYLAAEPIRYEDRALASLIDRRDGEKVDIIIRGDDAWGRSAMDRRVRWQHPATGSLWVSSLEDLILAKLEWSGGTSELQLRDCAQLLRMNDGSLDWEYLRSWAATLDLSRRLEAVHGQA